MKLFQTAYNDNFVDTIQGWVKNYTRTDTASLFHVYIPYNSDKLRDELGDLRKVLKENAPGIPVVGCTATGEILNGQMLDDEAVVTLTVFEDPSTKIEVLPFYDMPEGTGSDWLLEHAKSISDLKGMELITAVPYQKFDDTRLVMDQLPEEIETFGGVAVGHENYQPFVFGNECDICSDGSVIVYYSGPEFYIQTDRMFGWKPIGYPLTVTKSEGPVVYELDGKPAYDVYNHYLRIKKDAEFFYNALDFPWEVQVDKDTKCLRHAKSVNEDGSIVMSSDIPEGTEVKLTFGDPRRIIAHTKQTGLVIRDFGPQMVYIFNCMGRKLFWGGKEEIEIAEISKHMNTTGFSALGEIMRYKGKTLLNNLSLITVAMREGPAHEKIDLDIEKMEEPGDMPITARLAIFINTITDELMEKNEQLNAMLYKASHDALTDLLNRGAIERIIYEAQENGDSADNSKWYLIMFDIDDFKLINDECGHVEGDKILRAVAESLSDYVKTVPGVEVGRWGGEEFMLFVKEHSPSEVNTIAAQISDRIKEKPVSSKPVTISVGVTQHRSDEDVLQTITRVDELMYQAKNQGKDQVCSDL